MKRDPDRLRKVSRRSLLGCSSAALAAPFLRPILVSAQEAAPKRLLVVHRPCGSVLDKFFPTGDLGGSTLPAILAPFEPVRDDMVILDDTRCPRDPARPGDQHAAGLIAMMSGREFMPIPGTTADGDPNAKNIVAAAMTIDQYLLKESPLLQGASVPSIQATAFQPSSVGLPSFRVMSYAGPNDALFPESRPAQLFARIFGSFGADVSPEDLERMRAQHRSVLDYVNQDIARLYSVVPASQRPKLDTHMEGIRQLERDLVAGAMAAQCKAPVQVPLPNASNGVTLDEAQHLHTARNQLAIVKTAFECDLTRVATFTYAHGNSDMRFGNIAPGEVTGRNGHHTMSHDTGALVDLAVIEQLYAQDLSTFLQALKATPDTEGSLLDNTLVVYLNECSWGNTHGVEQMPTLLFGAKSLGLRGGRHLKYGGRTMNDIWAAVATAFGVPAAVTGFGDPAWNQGPAPDLFA